MVNWNRILIAIVVGMIISAVGSNILEYSSLPERIFVIAFVGLIYSPWVYLGLSTSAWAAEKILPPKREEQAHE